MSMGTRFYGNRRTLFALAALALGGGLAGCGGGGGGGGAGSGGTCVGSLQVAWTVNAQSAAVACAAAGATTVSLMVDNESMIADFDCRAGFGQTQSVFAGNHNVSLVVSDANGQALYTLPAMAVTVPCGALVDLGTVDLRPPVCDPPQVGATWSIDKLATGAPLTCEQAAATTVELTLNGTPFDFSCGAYQGLTTTLQPGAYNADFVLLDANGDVLSQTTQMAITVKTCGVTDLGDVLFDVQ
jgi:hypothetical protein